MAHGEINHIEFPADDPERAKAFYGAVAGWEAMRSRFGRLPMADLLAPAIFYAADGFPVSEIIAGSWAGWPMQSTSPANGWGSPDATSRSARFPAPTRSSV